MGLFSKARKRLQARIRNRKELDAAIAQYQWERDILDRREYDVRARERTREHINEWYRSLANNNPVFRAYERGVFGWLADQILVVCADETIERRLMSRYVRTMLLDMMYHASGERVIRECRVDPARPACDTFTVQEEALL